MAVSEAQKKSAKKYQNRNNKRFGIIMKKYEGEILENYLKNNKYSVNGFIVQAVKEKIERDTGKSFDEFLQEKETNNNQLDTTSSSGNDISKERN